MNDPENPSPNESPHKISIHPRLSNHQTKDRVPQEGANFEGLILQLTKVLEDYRTETQPTLDESHEEEPPRIRQTGQVPLSNVAHGGKRRRRKRRSQDDKAPPKFEKYIPGSRRRMIRRRKILLVVAAVVVAFIASNYSVAKFFYRSGISEGMQRGLQANSAVATKKASAPPSALLENKAPLANQADANKTKSPATESRPISEAP